MSTALLVQGGTRRVHGLLKNAQILAANHRSYSPLPAEKTSTGPEQEIEGLAGQPGSSPGQQQPQHTAR